MNTDEVRKRFESWFTITDGVHYSIEGDEYITTSQNKRYTESQNTQYAWEGYQQGIKDSEAEIERLKKELNDDRTFWDIASIAWQVDRIHCSKAKNQTDALAIHDDFIKRSAIEDFEGRIIEKAKEFNMVEVFSVINHVRRDEALKEANHGN